MAYAYDANALIDTAYYNKMTGESIAADSDAEKILMEKVNMALALFELICNRPLKARDFSYVSTDPTYDPDNAIFDGVVGTSFYFPTYPVNSITELKISGDVIPVAVATDYTGTDGYILYKKAGKIVYEPGFDSGYHHNILAKWNGGYAEGTEELSYLKSLTVELVKQLISGEINSSLISETLGTYKYQKMPVAELAKTRNIPPFIYDALVRFRKVPIG